MSVYPSCLKNIVTNILNTAKTTAETYRLGKDYLAGCQHCYLRKRSQRYGCPRYCLRFICTILNHCDWGFLCWHQKSSLFKIVSLKPRFILLLLKQKTGIQLFHLLPHLYLGAHYHSTSLEEHKKDSRLKYSERFFRLTNLG